MLIIFGSESNYGGWYEKGIYKLQNSTSSEMYSRLDKNVIITGSCSGYGRSAFFSIDGGEKKHLTKNMDYITEAARYFDTKANPVISLAYDSKEIQFLSKRNLKSIC